MTGQTADAQRQIDTRALEVATAALTKIDHHLDHHDKADLQQREDRAAFQEEMREMHRDTDASIRRVHVRIDGMGGRWLLTAAGVISVLLAILGYLVVNGLPWQ